MEPEIDSADARPSILATLMGCVTIATGLVALVTAVQLWTLFYLDGLRLVGWGILVLGSLLQMGLGGVTLRGSDVGTIAATAITWFLQLIALYVLVVALGMGLLSPLLFLWFGANALTSLLVPLAIPAALKTSRNRRKLYS